VENDQNIVPEPNKTNPVWIILLVVVILALIGLGYWYWNKNYYENARQDNSQPTSHLTEKPTSTPTASSTSNAEVQEQLTKLDTENSEHYGSAKYGYDIKYPKTWSISTKDINTQSVDFVSATDMHNGAVVSISVSEEGTNYETVKEWVENRPVGDPEGAEALKNTEYIKHEDFGTLFAKTETPQYNLLVYHWICGGNVIALSYIASGPDYETYMPTFKAIFESLVPCAG